MPYHATRQPPRDHHHHHRHGPPSSTTTSPFSSTASSCSWASGCCARHPISCRDTSHLRFAPSCEGGGPCGCAGKPVYTRPGRTGSKSTTTYLHDVSSCAQWGAFHDVLASSLPPHQRKVTVLREPCSRARSLLRHWHVEFPSMHPVQHVRTLSQFAIFVREHWADVTRRPWSEADPSRHHYIVGWPQAWYVDACTQVLCFERLDADLRGFCVAERLGAPWNSTTSDARQGVETYDEGCAAIRTLYAEDTRLHERHCRSTALVPTLATATASESRRTLGLAATAVAPNTSISSISSILPAPDVAAPPDGAACRGRAALLLVGLMGAQGASTAHAAATARLQRVSLPGSRVFAVGEALEAQALHAYLSPLPSGALGALGLVSPVALERPAFLPPSAAFATFPPPSQVTSRTLATSPRQSRQSRQSSHALNTTPGPLPLGSESGDTREDLARISGEARAELGMISRHLGGSREDHGRDAGRAQWHKLRSAWTLMEASERAEGRRPFDIVLKLRFDATPLGTFQPCASFNAAAAAGALLLHAASDKVFWGPRAAVAVAIELHEALARGSFGGGGDGLGSARVSVQRLLQLAEGVPPSAWSDRKGPRQHYNKVAMLPYPFAATAAVAASARRLPPQATDPRAHTLLHLYAALSMGCTSLGAYRADVSERGSSSSPRHEPVFTARLHSSSPRHEPVCPPVPTIRMVSGARAGAPTCLACKRSPWRPCFPTGARASALDRTGTTFVAERDFLIWLLHRNVTVCDLGAGTSELLYKGVPTPRPSLPCPAPARVPEQRTPLDRPRTDDGTLWSGAALGWRRHASNVA